jgi:hypothetical protein
VKKKRKQRSYLLTSAIDFVIILVKVLIKFCNRKIARFLLFLFKQNKIKNLHKDFKEVQAKTNEMNIILC